MVDGDTPIIAAVVSPVKCGMISCLMSSSADLKLKANQELSGWLKINLAGETTFSQSVGLVLVKFFAGQKVAVRGGVNLPPAAASCAFCHLKFKV